MKRMLNSISAGSLMTRLPVYFIDKSECSCYNLSSTNLNLQENDYEIRWIWIICRGYV